MNKNQWTTLIDNLMIWRGNNWSKYETKASSLRLRIHYDQLLLVSNEKVLESFNTNCKIKGIYKKDILILIVSMPGQEIRKLKFQIKADVGTCLFELGQRFPVMEHNSSQSKLAALAPSKYRNIAEVLKRALEKKECLTSVRSHIESVNFIKACLLDPSFPDTVLEINNIIQEKILNNN